MHVAKCETATSSKSGHLFPITQQYHKWPLEKKESWKWQICLDQKDHPNTGIKTENWLWTGEVPNRGQTIYNESPEEKFIKIVKTSKHTDLIALGRYILAWLQLRKKINQS